MMESGALKDLILAEFPGDSEEMAGYRLQLHLRLLGYLRDSTAPELARREARVMLKATGSVAFSKTVEGMTVLVAIPNPGGVTPEAASKVFPALSAALREALEAVGRVS